MGFVGHFIIALIIGLEGQFDALWVLERKLLGNSVSDGQVFRLLPLFLML